MQLKAVFIYPVKSLAGISMTEAVVQTRGLQWDRRWMLTDMSGKFITQREYPRLALLQPEIQNSGMTIRHKTDTQLSIRIPLEQQNDLRPVSIWGDQTLGMLMDPFVNEFFSDFLGFPCQMVYMTDSVHRKVDPGYDRGNNVVSYADGYPYLVLSEASLEDLNSRLDHPVPMDRFRPNFVISGTEPYAEDNFYRLRIGTVDFDAVKKCARCILPTIDQQTGLMGKEPLRTLSEYRREDNKVKFGMNLCLGDPGQVGSVVRVGDAISS